MSLAEKILKLEKRFLLTIAAFLSINAAAIPITSYINRNIDSDKKTAVFTSGYDPYLPKGIVSNVLDFFMYAPVTLRQNLRGNKVVWHSNSTREDVLDVLEDPQYQNLVFIGHGDNSTYETTNGTLNVDYLAGLHLPERRGEFIQHTCGSGEGRSLRDVLYPGGSTGYKFNRDVTAAENYGRALVELVM